MTLRKVILYLNILSEKFWPILAQNFGPVLLSQSFSMFFFNIITLVLHWQQDSNLLQNPEIFPLCRPKGYFLMLFKSIEYKLYQIFVLLKTVFTVLTM